MSNFVVSTVSADGLTPLGSVQRCYIYWTGTLRLSLTSRSPIYMWDQNVAICVLEDALTPTNARPSADTVMTRIGDVFSFPGY